MATSPPPAPISLVTTIARVGVARGLSQDRI